MLATLRMGSDAASNILLSLSLSLSLSLYFCIRINVRCCGQFWRSFGNVPRFVGRASVLVFSGLINFVERICCRRFILCFGFSFLGWSRGVFGICSGGLWCRVFVFFLVEQLVSSHPFVFGVISLRPIGLCCRLAGRVRLRRLGIQGVSRCVGGLFCNQNTGACHSGFRRRFCERCSLRAGFLQHFVLQDNQCPGRIQLSDRRIVQGIVKPGLRKGN